MILERRFSVLLRITRYSKKLRNKWMQSSFKINLRSVVADVKPFYQRIHQSIIRKIGRRAQQIFGLCSQNFLKSLDKNPRVPNLRSNSSRRTNFLSL